MLGRECNRQEVVGVGGERPQVGRVAWGRVVRVFRGIGSGWGGGGNGNLRKEMGVGVVAVLLGGWGVWVAWGV